MMADSSIRNRIYRAWRLRFIQKTEECFTLVTELKGDLGIPFGRISNLDQFAGSGRENEVSEVVLLAASLERANGDLASSNRLLEIVESFLQRQGISFGYGLFFQKGLNAYVIGDYSVALEHFLTARTMAKEESQRAHALVNSIHCMDNLSLPSGRTLAELKTLLKGIEPEDEESKEEKGIFERNLEFLYVQYAYWSGDFDRVFESRDGLDGYESVKTTDFTRMDQLSYYRLYCSGLPYHRHHHRLHSDLLEQLTLSSPFFHQKSYRVRSIQGLVHPDDSRNANPSALVNRIYLWVWKWLVDPKSFPIQRIMSSLENFSILENVHRMTAESTQELRNALLWIGLFDEGSHKFVQRVLDRIRTPGVPDYPVYEFENLVIHYFRAKAEGNADLARSYLISLEGHPLWKSESLLYKELIRGVETGESSSLSVMAANLHGLIYGQRPRVGTSVLVDVANFKVTSEPEGETVISESMTSAIELLDRKKAVGAEEFVAVCFGITRFDPIVHNPKIFNLLARLRTICSGTLSFSTKSGKVFAEGDWDRVQILRRHSLVEELGRQPEWKRLLYGKSGMGERDGVSSITGQVLNAGVQSEIKSSMKRQDIEKIIKKSRSSANRVLLKWEKQGLVFKEGNARNTRYRLSPRLIEMIQNGETE